MSNEKLSNEAETPALNKGAVRCSTCGKFMRRLKLLERVRLERTHICKYETITYSNGKVVHQ